MRSALKYLVSLVGLLALPFSANAVLITVDYAGHVSSDGGLGYAFGSAVSGTLTYDTALLPLDSDANPNTSIYSIGQFVTGYVPPAAPGIQQDWLYFFDQSYSVIAADRFEIGDNYVYETNDGAGNTYHLSESIGLTASDISLNFIVGASLTQSFALSAADGFDDFSAFLFRQEIRTENGETTLFSFRYAQLALDSLTVSTAATSVPEPGTLLLLSAGFLCAGLARRRRSAA